MTVSKEFHHCSFNSIPIVISISIWIIITCITILFSIFLDFVHGTTYNGTSIFLSLELSSLEFCSHMKKKVRFRSFRFNSEESNSSCSFVYYVNLLPLNTFPPNPWLFKSRIHQPLLLPIHPHLVS